jgi:hypothetical protein
MRTLLGKGGLSELCLTIMLVHVEDTTGPQITPVLNSEADALERKTCTKQEKQARGVSRKEHLLRSRSETTEIAPQRSKERSDCDTVAGIGSQRFLPKYGTLYGDNPLNDKYSGVYLKLLGRVQSFGLLWLETQPREKIEPSRRLCGLCNDIIAIDQHRNIAQCELRG